MYQIYLLMSVLLAQLVAHHDHDLPNKPNCRPAGPAPCRSSRPTQSLPLLIKILKIPDKNNENARSEFFRKSIDIITLTSKSKV